MFVYWVAICCAEPHQLYIYIYMLLRSGKPNRIMLRDSWLGRQTGVEHRRTYDSNSYWRSEQYVFLCDFMLFIQPRAKILPFQKKCKERTANIFLFFSHATGIQQNNASAFSRLYPQYVYVGTSSGEYVGAGYSPFNTSAFKIEIIVWCTRSCVLMRVTCVYICVLISWWMLW